MPVTLGSRPEHGFDQPLGLLGDCHRRIERFLEILQKVAGQAAGQPLNDEQRRAVEAALEYFRTAGPRHNADEEESLFPLLRASADPRARAALEAVKALEDEHAAASVAHAEAEFRYRRWVELGPPTDPQLRDLVKILHDLREMYRRHIDVEDRQIFPLAREVLSPAQLTRLGQQMAERRGLLHDPHDGARRTREGRQPGAGG